MNKILRREQLSKDVVRIEVEAPMIAEERQAGQFIILQLSDLGERIPLTIADANPTRGTITLIFQVVGRTTTLLSELKEGEEIQHLVGPLGTPTHVEKFGHVVCVGGGIGVAPLHPIAQAMKKAGNKVTVIMGARNKDLLILKNEMQSIADQLIICTDDGSDGRKDLVTIPLKEICESQDPPQMVVAIGPPVMMKFCAEVTREQKIPTVVSLNPIMVDGTGMCGGCRVNIGKDIRFVCVDGPEFDAHKVDFNNFIQRLGSYKEIEAKHKCRLETMTEQALRALK